MEHFDSAFSKKQRENLSPEKLKNELRKPMNHGDYYFPSGGSPDFEDLGITKADLEIFEEKLIKPKPLQADKPLQAKERDSLLKLVLGMAMDGYGYDVKASRSPTARDISESLLTRGISIDEDTVRKWLNQAKEICSPEMETV